MKPLTLFHCSDARLGRDDDRGRDRLRAFGRCVDAAIAAGPGGLLATGHLLEPGPPAPRLLSELEAILCRARDTGVTLWTTCEQREIGWLEYLAARRLVAVLEVRAGGAPPVAEPYDGLRVFGLGRPETHDELERRMAALGTRPRGVTSVILVNAVLAARRPGITRTLLGRLRTRAAYLAIGDNPEPAIVAETARDPGPLTRLELTTESSMEPGFLEVELQASPVVRERSARDRELLRLRIDITGAKRPEAIDKLLRLALGKERPVERPLVHIVVAGTSALEPAYAAEQLVLERAQAILDPIACAIDMEAEGGATPVGDRDASERELLTQLTAGREPGYTQLAIEVFNRLTGSDADAPAAAADAISRHLGRQQAPGRATRATR